MTTRPALPQNYQAVAQTEPYPLNSISGWSATGTGSYAGVDTSPDHIYDGVSGLQLNIAPGQMITLNRDDVYLSPLRLNHVRFVMTVYNNGTSGLYMPLVTLLLANDIGFTKYVAMRVFAPPGVSQIVFDPNTSTMIYVGGGSLDAPMLYFRIRIESQAAGNTTSVTISQLKFDVDNIPTVILSCDDCVISEYTTAFPIMSARGIRATAYVPINHVGADGIFMNLAQLQELYANGWDISVHGATHTDFTTLTQEQVEASVLASKNWLVENGMPRGALHAAYPFGNYNSTTIAAMVAQGMLSARTTVGNYYYIPPERNMYALQAIAINSSMTSDSVIAYMKTAMSIGATIHYLFHRIETPVTESTSWEVEKFTAVMDFLYSQRAKCNILTVSEWYNGLTNPRYRSLPVTRAVV